MRGATGKGRRGGRSAVGRARGWDRAAVLAVRSNRAHAARREPRPRCRGHPARVRPCRGRPDTCSSAILHETLEQDERAVEGSELLGLERPQGVAEVCGSPLPRVREQRPPGVGGGSTVRAAVGRVGRALYEAPALEPPDQPRGRRAPDVLNGGELAGCEWPTPRDRTERRVERGREPARSVTAQLA